MIGGEHEIRLLAQRDGFEPKPNEYYYSCGRAALYQILGTVRNHGARVWFPDWLCHTMVEAARRAGFNCVYYELNDSFLPTLLSLKQQNFVDGGILVVINYFGLLDIVDICKSIKEEYPHAIIIEDDVQAYFCFSETENEYADFRYTSLRKSFCIPDGALVYTKYKMPVVVLPNTFAYYKVVAGMMKANREATGIRDEDYLRLFKESNDLINDNYDSRMSLIAERLFAGTDFAEEKRVRVMNANYLIDGLREKGIQSMMPFSADKVPLFLPIYLENRDEVRKRMFQNEVFCPVHWPLEGMPLKKGKEMAEHELSLIVDSRYTLRDMDMILSCI